MNSQNPYYSPKTLLGLDPFKLSYPHNGLPARVIGPTDHAHVPKELLA